jgi:hypothetical protein
LKRILVTLLACILLSPVLAISQTQRAPRKRTSTSFAEKQQAEIRAGRVQIAAQIKTLTQFLYLFGGISRSIETAEQVNRNHEESSVAISSERIAQNRAKIKGSIRDVRVGLAQLESSFRLNPVLQTFYSRLEGVANLGRSAESQAEANNLDEAGKSLIATVNKLADALVEIR